jgi:hypothetical protein
MNNDNEFVGFSKMARLSRDCIITEKIDGTNAQIYITKDGKIFAGSRNRWITPEDDNFGFAQWVRDNENELLTLGPGRHFGEWWGQGIQRNYGMGKKLFSLFNVLRWVLHGQEPNVVCHADPRIKHNQSVLPYCVGLVPVLYRGEFSTVAVDSALNELRINGSKAAEGFMKPEGVVCYHIAGNVLFKKTIEGDESPKSFCKHDKGAK